MSEERKKYGGKRGVYIHTHIHTYIHTYIQAICREIEGSGCLGRKGIWRRKDDDAEETSFFTQILILLSLGLSVLCPLFR